MKNILIFLAMLVCADVIAQQGVGLDQMEEAPDSAYMILTTGDEYPVRGIQKYRLFEELHGVDTIYRLDDSLCIEMVGVDVQCFVDEIEGGGGQPDTYIDTGFFANDTIIFWRVDSAANVIDSFKIALPVGAADTDDQQVDNFSISGNTITLEIQDDGQAPHTLDVPDQPDSITSYNGLTNQTPDSIKLGGLLVDSLTLIDGDSFVFAIDSLSIGRVTVYDNYIIQSIRDTLNPGTINNSNAWVFVGPQGAWLLHDDYVDSTFTRVITRANEVLMSLDKPYANESSGDYGEVRIDTSGLFVLPTDQSEIDSGWIAVTTEANTGKFIWQHFDSIGLASDSLIINGDTIKIFGGNPVVLPSDSFRTWDLERFGAVYWDDDIDDFVTDTSVYSWDGDQLRVNNHNFSTNYNLVVRSGMHLFTDGIWPDPRIRMSDKAEDWYWEIGTNDDNFKIHPKRFQFDSDVFRIDSSGQMRFGRYGDDKFNFTTGYIPGLQKVLSVDTNGDVFEVPIDSVWNSAAGTMSGDSVDFDLDPYHIVYADVDSSLTTNSSSGDSLVLKMGDFRYMYLDFPVGNASIGLASMSSVTTGQANTAMGAASLPSLTMGNQNVAIGTNTGQSLTTGSQNMYLGAFSGGGNSTGSHNTALGAYAGAFSTGQRNVFLGYQAGQNASGDDQLYIANSLTNSPLIYGDFALGELKINGSNWVVDERLDSDGDAGTSGQVLSSTASGTNWVDADSVGSPSGDDDWRDLDTGDDPTFLGDIQHEGKTVVGQTTDMHIISNPSANGVTITHEAGKTGASVLEYAYGTAGFKRASIGIYQTGTDQDVEYMYFTTDQDSATTGRLQGPEMLIYPTGALRLSDYGNNAFEAIPETFAGWDNAGDFVEVTLEKLDSLLEIDSTIQDLTLNGDDLSLTGSDVDIDLSGYTDDDDLDWLTIPGSGQATSIDNDIYTLEKVRIGQDSLENGYTLLVNGPGIELVNNIDGAVFRIRERGDDSYISLTKQAGGRFTISDGTNTGLYLQMEEGYNGSMPLVRIDDNGQVALDKYGDGNMNAIGSENYIIAVDDDGNLYDYPIDSVLNSEGSAQTLNLVGDDLSISGGNTVDLSSTDNQGATNFTLLTNNSLILQLENNATVYGTSLDKFEQDLTYSAGSLTISDGNTVDISGIDTDDQTLSIVGPNLTISDGNTIDISGVDTNTDEQTLSIADGDLTITDGNTIDISGVDTDEQTLTISGDELTIVRGNTVTLPGSDDDQTLSISGSILTIEDGNSVTLPSGGGGGGATTITSDSIVWNTLDNAHHVMFTDDNDIPSTDDDWTDLVLMNDTTRYLYLGETQFFFGKDAGGTGFLGWNSVVGPSAMVNATGHRFAAAVGFEALANISGGLNNSALGANAGAELTGGNDNVLIGFSAGDGTSGVSDFDRNTFVGSQSAQNYETGNDNVYLGFRSGRQAEGTGGIGIGRDALYSASDVNYGIAIGWRSAYLADWGDYNIAIGYESMRNAGDGTAENSIVMGWRGGYDADGVENIIIGRAAGYVMDGDNNIAIGSEAGRGVTTGSNNIFLGHLVGDESTYSSDTSLLIIDPYYDQDLHSPGDELIWAFYDSLNVNSIVTAPTRMESGAFVRVSDGEIEVESSSDNVSTPSGTKSRWAIPDEIGWGNYDLTAEFIYESQTDSTINHITVHATASSSETWTALSAAISGTERKITQIVAGRQGPLFRPTIEFTHEGWPGDAKISLKSFVVDGDKLNPRWWSQKWIIDVAQTVTAHLTLEDEYFEDTDGSYAGWHFLPDGGVADLIEENDSINMIAGDVIELTYDAATGDLTLDHEEYPAITNTNTGTTVIQSFSSDQWGHVTNIGETTIDEYSGWDAYNGNTLLQRIHESDNVVFSDGILIDVVTEADENGVEEGGSGNGAINLSFNHVDNNGSFSGNGAGSGQYISSVYADDYGHLSSVGVSNLPDASSFNEIQTISSSLSGSNLTISLSNGGGSTTESLSSLAGMTNWDFEVNGTKRLDVGQDTDVNFSAGSGISFGWSGTSNTLTINSTSSGGDGDGAYDGNGTVPFGTTMTIAGDFAMNYGGGGSEFFINSSISAIRGNQYVIIGDLANSSDELRVDSDGNGPKLSHELASSTYYTPQQTVHRFYVSNSQKFSMGSSQNTSYEPLVVNGTGLNSAYALHVYGNALKTAGGTEWDDTSDKRIKENINYLDTKKAMQEFAKLKPASFDYQDWYADLNSVDREQRYHSYIAQDVQKVFPDAVFETDMELDSGEKILAIKSNILAGHHKAATIQLIKENEDLKSRVEKLELLVNKLIEK